MSWLPHANFAKEMAAADPMRTFVSQCGNGTWKPKWGADFHYLVHFAELFDSRIPVASTCLFKADSETMWNHDFRFQPTRSHSFWARFVASGGTWRWAVFLLHFEARQGLMMLNCERQESCGQVSRSASLTRGIKGFSMFSSPISVSTFCCRGL